jgi:hypothetical protein
MSFWKLLLEFMGEEDHPFSLCTPEPLVARPVAGTARTIVIAAASRKLFILA